MGTPLTPDPADGPAQRDIDRARQTAIGQLLERGIEVADTAGEAAIVEVLEAVERFEAAAAAAGGDSFTNTLDSSSPDDARLTLPQPRADESIQEYAARVRQKTEEIAGS